MTQQLKPEYILIKKDELQRLYKLIRDYEIQIQKYKEEQMQYHLLLSELNTTSDQLVNKIMD